MDRKLLYPVGAVLNETISSGYVVKRDIYQGDKLASADLEGFGGCPNPVPNDPIPDWLNGYVYPSSVRSGL